MGKVEFKLDKAAVGRLLKSPEVQKLTESKAAAYSGEKKSFIGFDRAKTVVYEKGGKAKK